MFGSRNTRYMRECKTSVSVNSRDTILYPLYEDIWMFTEYNDINNDIRHANV